MIKSVVKHRKSTWQSSKNIIKETWTVWVILLTLVLPFWWYNNTDSD